MSIPALPGHPHIAYRGADLYIEDVALADLARTHGTPLYVYSQNTMLDALAAYQRGFAGRKVQICFAMKANSSLAILQLFARAGCGFDIVSGGELARVLAAGGDPGKVIFSGVGKTRAEMRQALRAGIRCFNVESEAELEVLSAVAQSMGLRAPVSIRVNPNVDAKTHPYISTGLKDNKFGIAHDQALNADVVLPRLLPEASHTPEGCTQHANLIIEGDNFDALRLLQATHTGKIRVIYIDPPYNTGNKDWVYNDQYVGQNDRWRHSQWWTISTPPSPTSWPSGARKWAPTNRPTPLCRKCLKATA